MRIRLLALIVMMSPTVAMARTNWTELCKASEPTIEKEIPIKQTPNYFFRTFPTAQIVSYGSSGGNRVLDLQSGTEISAPGTFDPVPFWSEQIITVPMLDPDTKSTRMTFFDFEDIKKNQINATPLLSDTDLAGFYQSVGLLTADKKSENYLVLTDKNGATVRQYRVTTSMGGSSKRQIEPVGPPVVLCKGKDLKLPMLSKDGTELAALDMASQTTKIFHVDYKTGTCSETLSLGLRVGKVDFSFDGRYLVFHTSNALKVADHGYYRQPPLNWNLQVKVFDRKTGHSVAVTMDPMRNSYYPVFRKDNRIVFLRSSSDNSTFSFAVANPIDSKTESSDIEARTGICPTCKASTQSFQPAIDLLTKSCQIHLAAEQKRNASGSVIDFDTVVQRRCAMCHSQGQLQIDFSSIVKLKNSPAKLSSGSLADAILKRLEGADGLLQMPVGVSLTETEKKVLSEKLRGSSN